MHGELQTSFDFDRVDFRTWVQMISCRSFDEVPTGTFCPGFKIPGIYNTTHNVWQLLL